MKKLLLCLVFFTSMSNIFAVVHHISFSTVFADGASMGVQPGDTVYLEAGLKPYLLLKNFQGSPENYITIINFGGRVEISNDDFFYGMVTYNCRYFRLTGTGDPDIFYGITITASNGESNGLSLDEFSSDFEIDHLEIYNTGFAGIISKTNPSCDSLRNRGNFTQYNTIFHDNYIHKTGGEGMYLGHSYYAGYQKNCEGETVVLYPHDLINIKVFNNIIDSTGYDGIQIGCAIEGCEIYGNVISNAGFTDNALGLYYGMSGIVLGGGTSGLCYNNLIYDGYGTGISIFGLGDIWVINNVIVDAGRNSNLLTEPPDNHQAYGIFCDDRTTIAGSSFNLIHNTIINPRDIGIRFWSLQSMNNRMYNNLIINPGVKQWNFNRSMIDVINPSLANADTLSGGNYFDSTEYTSVSNPYFVDEEELDFHLKPGAPNIDQGIIIDSLENMDFDFDLNFRPMGKSSDAGAFEFPTLPDSILIRSDDSILCVGNTFQLIVDSIITADQFSFQWLLNDSTIPGQESSTLMIDSLTLDDQGIYKAMLTNGFSEIYSNGFLLNVISKPFVSAGNDTTICTNYSGLNLEAKAGNYSGMLWSTNGDGYFEADTTLLSFYNPGEEDKMNGSVVLSITAFGDETCGSVTDSLTLTFDPCTGVNDILSNIRIYPNPAGDYLMIRSDEPILSLRLFDLLGNLLIEKFTNNRFENLNLESYQLGMYVLQLIYRNKIETRKIIRK